MNEFFLAIYCCAYTIQWHHLDSTLRRGARGSSLFWLDFSALDSGLSRSCPRAACFLFKMYGCVNVCVCTYNPTSIDCLFLFSFCFQLWLWFHLLTLGDLCWTSPKVLVWPLAIIENDTLCTYFVSAQRPIFNKIENIVTRWTCTLESFSLGVGRAGDHFGLVSPFEMNIHKRSRGWNQIWKSCAPLHVRGLENPVLCDMMWRIVSDMVAYSTWREHVY